MLNFVTNSGIIKDVELITEFNHKVKGSSMSKIKMGKKIVDIRRKLMVNAVMGIMLRDGAELVDGQKKITDRSTLAGALFAAFIQQEDFKTNVIFEASQKLPIRMLVGRLAPPVALWVSVIEQVMEGLGIPKVKVGFYGNIFASADHEDFTYTPITRACMARSRLKPYALKFMRAALKATGEQKERPGGYDKFIELLEIEAIPELMRSAINQLEEL
jgi:hypothetical protein